MTQHIYIRENEEEKTIHITKLEFNGLKTLIQYLSRSKSVVDGIDQQSLLNEAKLMIEDHKDDDADLAITGQPVVTPMPEADPKQDCENGNTKTKAATQGVATRKRKNTGKQNHFDKNLS